MEEKRTYFVIDARSFYASVEAVSLGLDPMRTKLVVADASRTDKTICLAVSPALKKMGVRNRCRLYEVPKDPDIVIAKPRMRKYISVSASIYGVYLRHISKDDMHVYSIDEVIMDVTTYLKLYGISAVDFARKLMKEANAETGIPFTCGIGCNMYLAKVASGIMAKRSEEGIGILDEESFIRELSFHRPLSDFWQISYGIENRLAKYGIFDMAGIREANEDLLYREFGVNAELIIDHAHGKEPTRMVDIKNYKSESNGVSTNQILSRPYGKGECMEVMLSMIESFCLDMAMRGLVSSRLAVSFVLEEDKKKRRPSTHFFCDIAGRSNLASDFIPLAKEQYERWIPNGAYIRSVAIGFADVKEQETFTYNLFEDPERKKKDLALRDSLLAIQTKFGKNAVLRAYDFTPSSTRRERNDSIGGHAGGEEDE